MNNKLLSPARLYTCTIVLYDHKYRNRIIIDWKTFFQIGTTLTRTPKQNFITTYNNILN